MKTMVAVLVFFVLGMVGDADAGRSRGGSSRSYKSSSSSGTGSKSSSTRVKGYTTKSGTYVAPYRRTTPDRTQRNNYSTKGNVNPYTGKRGTKSPSR